MCNCFSKNLGLKGAAKREVGNGANQVPDMSAFPSYMSGNSGYYFQPGGIIEQFMIVTIPPGGSKITFPPVFKFPSRVVNIQAIHWGGSSFYAVATVEKDGSITLLIKPGTSAVNASFYVKLTGY